MSISSTVNIVEHFIKHERGTADQVAIATGEDIDAVRDRIRKFRELGRLVFDGFVPTAHQPSSIWRWISDTAGTVDRAPTIPLTPLKPPQTSLPALTVRKDLEPIFGITVDKSTLRRWEAIGKWPNRIVIGPRSVAWRTAEVIEALGLDAAAVIAAWRVRATGVAS